MAHDQERPDVGVLEVVEQRDLAHSRGFVIAADAHNERFGSPVGSVVRVVVAVGDVMWQAFGHELQVIGVDHIEYIDADRVCHSQHLGDGLRAPVDPQVRIDEHREVAVCSR